MVYSIMTKFLKYNRYQILALLLLASIVAFGLSVVLAGGIYNLLNDEGILTQFSLAFELFSNALYVCAIALVVATGAGTIALKKNGLEEQGKGTLMAFVMNSLILGLIFVFV